MTGDNKDLLTPDVVRLGEILSFISAAMIPIALGSISIVFKNLSFISLGGVAIMIITLFAGLAFSIEGLIKKNENWIKLSRYFIYAALAIYLVIIIGYINASVEITSKTVVSPFINSS